MPSYDEWKRILAPERLPAMLVDLDAFDRNLQKLAELARGKPVRIATKSIRVPELLRRALARTGAGLMCYSAEEVELLAREGFDDFLLAYPTVQRSDLEALRRAHDQGRRVSAVVDSTEAVRRLSRAMEDARAPFPVLIEIDVASRLPGLYFGVRRSPVRTDRQILALATEISKHASLRLEGVMAYEAQVAGVTDRNPFKKLLNRITGPLRQWSAKRVARRRRQIRELFELHKLGLRVFNGGGTGSLSFAAGEAALTELAAGSALFSPHLFDYYSNFRFEPACFFALQAVRAPGDGMVTCLGGGYVASGEPGWDKVPLPVLPAAKLLHAEAAGEVQTPLVADGVAIGDPVLFRHAKAGELAERFNEALLVSGGKIVSRAKTYRGLGFSFL